MQTAEQRHRKDIAEIQRLHAKLRQSGLEYLEGVIAIGERLVNMMKSCKWGEITKLVSHGFERLGKSQIYQYVTVYKHASIIRAAATSGRLPTFAIDGMANWARQQVSSAPAMDAGNFRSAGKYKPVYSADLREKSAPDEPQDDPEPAVPAEPVKIEIYAGDSRKIVPQLAKKGFQYGALIVDPPFGNTHLGLQWDDDVAQRAETWQAITAALKPGGYVACFVGEQTIDLVMSAMRQTGLRMLCIYYWKYKGRIPIYQNVSKLFGRRDKGRKIIGYRKVSGYHSLAIKAGHQNYTRVVRPVYKEYVTKEALEWRGFGFGSLALKRENDPILIFQKPISERTTLENIEKHGVGAMNIELLRQRRGGDFPTHIFKHNKAAKSEHGSQHPTPKPVALIADLVALLCPAGEIVLDAFAGSGTTGAACLQVGRDVVLIEKDPRWLPDLKRRTGQE